MKHKSRIYLFTALILIFFAYPAIHGDTYYVSPTGSGGNPGTWDEPWSLFKANNSVQPGDTILLKDGTYSTQIAPASSGTSENWIQYRAVNPLMAVIDGVDFAIELTDRSYIMINSVKVLNAGHFIYSYYSHHITVNDCYFDGAWRSKSTRFSEIGDYLTFTNNIVKNGSDNVFIRGGSYHIIEGNTFDTASHTCLVLCGVRYSAVRGNILTNPIQKCMEVFATRDVPEDLSMYNLIEGNTFGPSAGAGIQYAGNRMIIRRNTFKECIGGMNMTCYIAAGLPEAWHDVGNRFYNNVIVDCTGQAGIRFGLNMINIDDNIVMNNIIYGNSCTIFRADSTIQIAVNGDDACPSQSFFYNNDIIADVSGQTVYFWQDSKEDKDRHERNLALTEYEANYPQLTSNNIEVDPAFVDPLSDNYRLQAGSDCIDAARALTSTFQAGTGRTIHVKDSTYFCDGYGIIDSDVIRVGDDTVTIVSINYERDRIIVDTWISWAADAPVTLDYTGNGPDIGIYEF